MDLEGLQCHGCGSTNVTFDPKRRILSCNQCGKEEYYSRSTLNANGKVVYARRNAIHFFKEGRMDDAKHYAMEVLNISMDNAPAMYILAYYDEFTARKPDSMRLFFEQIMDVALEYDEVRDICSLIMASAYNLADFEEEVIQLIAVNMQSPDDARELCTVIDTICPFLISKRTSAGYLTDNLVEMYRELAEHCGIPKTCFALLKSIETNPDSPYVGKSFYLKAKVRYFYDNYIVNVGKVIRAMNDANMKAKFVGAYESKCQQYRVFSIGCGACPDLMAFEAYLQKNNFNKTIEYRGIDKNPLWEPVHNQIKQYDTDEISYINLATEDVFTFLEQFSVGDINVLVLQYVISALYTAGGATSIDRLFDLIIDSIVKERDKAEPFVILINDVNSRNLGRDLFLDLQTKLQAAGINGSCSRFYFDKNIQFEGQRYGAKHEKSSAMPPKTAEKYSDYEPWQFCTSAQLLIEVGGDEE